MECNFTVGQKVVCVNSDRAKNLKKNGVYTIKLVKKGDIPNLGLTGVISWFCLELVEAEPNRGHIGFCPSRFRPVVERKTDISVFKAMLNPLKEQVTA